MSLQIFRTKHITADTEENHGLKRCLSAWDLAFLGIGAIIGTGIFVLTGIAAATQAGPAVVLSFIFAGLACAFAALSYAELSAFKNNFLGYARPFLLSLSKHERAGASSWSFPPVHRQARHGQKILLGIIHGSALRIWLKITSRSQTRLGRFYNRDVN